MFNAPATFKTNHLQTTKTPQELWVEKVNDFIRDSEEKPRNLPLIVSNRIDNNALFVGGLRDASGYLMQGTGYGGNPNTYVMYWTNPISPISGLGINNPRNLSIAYSGFVLNNQGSFPPNPGLDYDVFCYLNLCLIRNLNWIPPTPVLDNDYIPLLSIPIGNAKFTTSTGQYTTLRFNGAINLSNNLTGSRAFNPERIAITSDELNLLLSGQYSICCYVAFWYTGNPAYSNPAINSHINNTFFTSNAVCNLTYTGTNITT